MKVKKYIAFSICLLIINIFCITDVIASAPKKVQARQDDWAVESCWGNKTYFTIKRYTYNKNSKIAYCTGTLRQNAPVGTVYKKKELPAGILYLIENGYQDNTAYDNMTDKQLCGYYQTQVAIWQYLDETLGGNYYSGLLDDGTYEKGNKLYDWAIGEVAKAKKQEYPTASVSLSPKKNKFSLSSDKQYYETGWFTVEATPKLSSYTVSVNNAPPDYIIINEKNENKSKFSSSEKKFKIKIPAKSINAVYDKIEVRVEAKVNIKKAYEYKEENTNNQPIVLVGNFTETATATSTQQISAIQSCNCSSSDVNCAINYCDETLKVDPNERDACIRTTCKITDPNFAICAPGENSQIQSGSNTICTDSTISTKKTCISSNGNTYYKAHCTEKTTAHFNDSLPSLLKPGMGFSYSVQLNGSKVCRLIFDVDKWNYDYARANDDGRLALRNIRDKYLAITNNITTYTDIEKYLYDSEKYLYNSTDANITLDVEENVANKSTISTKKLNRVVKKQSTVAAKGTGNFTTIDNPLKQHNHRVIESQMNSIYSLPEMCIDGAGGVVYDAKYDEISKTYKCNKISDGPYKKFFTNLKANYTINDTVVKITKESSAMNDLTNKCYYQIDDQPLTCVIEQQGQEYTLKVKGEHDIDYNKLEYILSTDPNKKNWTISTNKNSTLGKLTTSRTDYTVYGKIRYAGTDTVVATCSKTPQNKPTGQLCRNLYKPLEYQKIMAYCQENWHIDKEDYISEKACYDACTGINSCKVEYSCEEIEKKEQFCRKIYDPLTQNNAYRACINDCACSDGQAVYRPISLTNPFPNRQAGSNWQGYEANIKPLEEQHKPEYVIELSANDIAEINKQTNAYNDKNKGRNAYIDYVWAEDSDINGKYVSKFIHETNSDMFCIIDGEGECD